MQTESLIRVIKAMFLVLVMGFVYVLFRSLGGPSRVTTSENLFDDVVIGQTAARRLGNDKVWVTRLSSLHRNQASEVSGHVRDANAGCQIVEDLCVLKAATQRNGIDIIFTANAPDQLPSSKPWYGGFVDPTTGEVFDRLGRAYADNRSDRIVLEVLVGAP